MGVVGNTYLFLDWVLVVDAALGVDVYAEGDGAFYRKPRRGPAAAPVPRESGLEPVPLH